MPEKKSKGSKRPLQMRIIHFIGTQNLFLPSDTHTHVRVRIRGQEVFFFLGKFRVRTK